MTIWPLNAIAPERREPFGGDGKNLAASYFPARRCAVSSARKSLTAEFGMGSGVPSSPWLPKACGRGAYARFRRSSESVANSRRNIRQIISY